MLLQEEGWAFEGACLLLPLVGSNHTCDVLIVRVLQAN